MGKPPVLSICARRFFKRSSADAAHPSHFHPCDFLAASFQLGPCVFCLVMLLFQFGDKGLDLLLILLIGRPG